MRSRPTVLVVCLFLAVAAGCGSHSGHATAKPVDPSTTTQPSTSVAPRHRLPGGRGARISVSTSVGDSLMWSAYFGTPTAPGQSGADAAALAGCGVNDRDLVVPAEVILRITSQLPTSAKESIYPDPYSNVGLLWELDDGATCTTDITHGNLRPEEDVHIRLWVIYKGAVTPNSPNGDLDVIGQEFIQVPTFSIAGRIAEIQSIDGPRVLNCGAAGGVVISPAGTLPTTLTRGFGTTYTCQRWSR